MNTQENFTEENFETGVLTNKSSLINDFQDFCGYDVQEANLSAEIVLFYDQINLY